MNLYWSLKNSKNRVSEQRFVNSKFQGSIIYVHWMIGEGLCIKSEIPPTNHGNKARKGKVRILCVHIETSSLCAVFVNKNRCMSVLVSEEDKSIWFKKILMIHIKVSAMTRIFHWFFVWKMDPMSSILWLLYSPETVHCSTKNAYTSEITIFTL